VRKKYEESCNAYVKAFSEKQEVEFDGWIGDEVWSLVIR